MASPAAALSGPQREFERYRDIPLSCICSWAWNGPGHRWARSRHAPGCPWHTSAERLVKR